METKLYDIPGLIEFIPKVIPDRRGNFCEIFQQDFFRSATNSVFDLQQANISYSRKGVLRGIHYTQKFPGQRKLVTAVAGNFLDVVVDLRLDSASFARWQAIELSAQKRNSVYLTAGLGHAVLALDSDSVLVYLCDNSFNPENEFTIYPFDSSLSIKWFELSGLSDGDFILSDRDRQAPLLNAAIASRILPVMNS